MIATDHAPHAPEEKMRGNIWSCDCGFPGVETQMPIMLTEVNRGRMSIGDYVRWSAVNPAKAWGLYPTAISVGSPSGWGYGFTTSINNLLGDAVPMILGAGGKPPWWGRTQSDDACLTQKISAYLSIGRLHVERSQPVSDNQMWR